MKDKLYDFLFKCGAVATTAVMLIGVAMILITGIQRNELQLDIIAIRTAVGSTFISLGHIGLVLSCVYFVSRKNEAEIQKEKIEMLKKLNGKDANEEYHIIIRDTRTGLHELAHIHDINEKFLFNIASEDLKKGK